MENPVTFRQRRERLQNLTSKKLAYSKRRAQVAPLLFGGNPIFDFFDVTFEAVRAKIGLGFGKGRCNTFTFYDAR